jgi:hypothetical protein
MPGNSVYVGRPTRWGNPYEIDSNLLTVTSPGGGVVIACESLAECRACAAQEYRGWLLREGVDDSRQWLKRLRGKDLACWCPLDQPCHADVLLELANAADAVARGPREGQS